MKKSRAWENSFTDRKCDRCGGALHPYQKRFCGHTCSHAVMAEKRRLTETDFWNLVNKTEGCWLWTGRVNNRGYGIFANTKAHRYSYALAFGDPGDGFVCHKCDVPNCVRPDHFFLGSAKENAADMVAKGRHFNGYSLRQTCSKGHPFDRVYSRPRTRGGPGSGAWRQCSICNNERRRERCRRQRDAAS